MIIAIILIFLLAFILFASGYNLWIRGGLCPRIAAVFLYWFAATFALNGVMLIANLG